MIISHLQRNQFHVFTICVRVCVCVCVCITVDYLIHHRSRLSKLQPVGLLWPAVHFYLACERDK
jgi:hypothetical protein